MVSLVKQSLDGTQLSKCADINSDGNINILDIVIVVKQIIGGNEETVIDPNDFVSVWKITKDDNKITIPTVPGLRYNYTIDWGDKSDIKHITTGENPFHEYSDQFFEDKETVNVTITISITDIEEGAFPRIKFAGSGQQSKIIAIPSLGAVGWTSFDQAFDGCSNLVEIHGGDLSKVTSTYRMFREATNAVPDTSEWDVSSVTNMREMFYRASSATPNTTNWDVSSAQNFYMMFRDAVSANPDVKYWNTRNVTTMHSMFRGATSATPDTSGEDWVTTMVTSMREMFMSATNANPDTANWDTSKVKDMREMFSNAVNARPTTWNLCCHGM